MSEPTPPAAKGRGLSMFLWASGAVLWLLVGVLLVGTYLRRDRPAQAAEPAPSAAADAKPASPWNPKGVADFSLTERGGETVTKKDLLGKPWVVGFIFTRCAGPCPRVTGQMRVLQDQLKDEDFRLVTMTVDPDHDTPAVLTDYADLFGADKEKWLFLTGDKQTMYRYIEKNFLMPVQETEGEDRKPGFEVIHTTNLLLVDAKGVVRGKYNALAPEEMAKLRRDLKKLES